MERVHAIPLGSGFAGHRGFPLPCAESPGQDGALRNAGTGCIRRVSGNDPVFTSQRTLCLSSAGFEDAAHR